MPDEIKVTLTADASGLVTGVKVATDSIGGVDKAASDASQGGFAALTKGAMDLKAALDMGSIVFETTDQLLSAGEAGLRTNAAFNTIVGNTAPEWMDKLKAATHGAVDDIDLAHTATMLFASGLVKTSDEAARLVQIATDLGISVQQLPQMLEQAGATGRVNAFAQYGINIKAMKEEIKGGTSALQAFEDVAGPLADKLDPIVAQTSQWDKLKTSIGDTADTLKEQYATAFNSVFQTDGVLDHLKGIWDNLGAHPTLTLTAIVQELNLKGNLEATNQQDNTADAAAHDAFLNLLYPNRQSSAMSTITSGLGGLPTGKNAPIPQDTGPQNLPGGLKSYYSSLAPTYQDQFAQDASGASGLGRTMLDAATQDFMGSLGKAMAADERATPAILKLADSAENAAAKFKTWDAAFGVGKGTGGYSDIGAGETSGMQAAFAAREKADIRNYGANSQKTKDDIRADKAAMDEWLISTGQESQASLDAKAKLDTLNASMAAGTITAGSYTAQMHALTAAVEGGSSAWAAYNKSQNEQATGNADDMHAEQNALRRGSKLPVEVTDALKTSATMTDPFALVKQSAVDTKSKINDIGPAGVQAGSGVSAGMAQASSALAITLGVAIALDGVLRDIRSMGA